ncbi:MAG: tryptophan--tRNA ligase [Candidatus Omnitrophota bacterium]|nr:tryptophan--tRNA ligase [Candidatus Omnitrophota bacterium]MBU2527972.1 tryptophan--tRNA ligase [bacterium]MBU3930133.1 tryptophan--tRNA ligase [bacterium]MBU4123035.1 tryptophan--tRNA ligase [bacterium]
MKKKRILSGMRPTGAMHLGHFFGALGNWVKMQDEYETFYMVADWHAMTTLYDKTSDMAGIRSSADDMVADWLACGIDTSKSCIFRQSDVPAHSELFLILSMVTPLGWLQRCPTYKEQLKEIKNHDIGTFGFLGYPVLQASDILLYRAHCVPVGEDQLPHLEITREIARRFNHLYPGPDKVFPEPKALLTESPRLLGTDGRKMSKSYGNAVNLSDDEKTTAKKISLMITDPERIHKDDAGHPEVCSVFSYWKAIPGEKNKEISSDCKNASIGCVACKKLLAEEINLLLLPVREARKKISPEEVHSALESGSEKARAEAAETMAIVRDSIKI